MSQQTDFTRSATTNLKNGEKTKTMTIQNMHLATVTRRTITRITRSGLIAVAALMLAGSLSTARADFPRIDTRLPTRPSFGAPTGLHPVIDPAWPSTSEQIRQLPISEEAAFSAKFSTTQRTGCCLPRLNIKVAKYGASKPAERYVPQYGGYCAFGVSVGAKFDGDPTLFRVVDGKLYFNLNPKIQGMWLKDIPGNITKADQSWTQIWGTAPAELS